MYRKFDTSNVSKVRYVDFDTSKRSTRHPTLLLRGLVVLHLGAGSGWENKKTKTVSRRLRRLPLFRVSERKKRAITK